jgi:hypothetical protein
MNGNVGVIHRAEDDCEIRTSGVFFNQLNLSQQDPVPSYRSEPPRQFPPFPYRE